MASPNKKSMDDVSHPSKTAASPTSRPIIVGHGPMMRDPTLKKSEKDKEKEAEDESKLAAARRKDKIIEAPKEPEAETPEPETPESETPEPEEPAESPEPTDDEEPEKLKKTESAGPKLSEEERARREAAAKLVESKQYFLPIREAKRKRRTRMALLIFILLLVVGVAAADILIDAGIIKTDIPPLANLIEN